MMENKEQLIVDVNDYDTEMDGRRSGKISKQDFISVLRANSMCMICFSVPSNTIQMIQTT